jgi:signal transduction histidine kinase
MTRTGPREKILVPARPHVLTAMMVLSVAAVAALAHWDEQRESAAALEDFAQEQATLAASVASEISARTGVTPVRRGAPLPDLLRGLDRLERPNSLVILIQPPDGSLRTTDGREVHAPDLAQALAGGLATLRLPRASAAGLGLSERVAMAGLAHLDAGPLGRWGVAVVASAERQRDRESWARIRLVLATTLAAGLVVGFGGQALRRQRQELALQHELEVSEVERERDERLARLSRAATMVTLASGMAHEISTPLGVISGRAEQLAEPAPGDERTRRAAAAILEQSERIKDIVRGFLNLARGGSPTLQSVSPTHLIDAAAALVEHRFDKAGVRLARSAPAPLPAVRCDPTLLEHALVNLLLNACDVSLRGGTVELAARTDPGGLAFVVTDDGDGIAEVDASRATEPFFTTKPQGKGTGLGLAIVNEIAKCHRGSFSIEPGQPRGTRACIHLPLEGSAA